MDDTTRPEKGHKHVLLERPVFIAAVPRSGSTLLFETLACSHAFNTFGGEAHWLVEDLETLRPGTLGVDSNRLTALQATPEVIDIIQRAALARLQGPEGAAPTPSARLLEKTPKNSLRIPFLKQVFPDARFIFNWREPRENISSLMEAWRSGRFVTYASLPGWDGPWSMLLPPNWQPLRGAPLEVIAAWQWQKTNEIVLEDLKRLPRSDWTAVSHHEFVTDPNSTVERLCGFLGEPLDQPLRARTATQLPASRSPQTPPSPDKWQFNADAIERVLPDIERCWNRLASL